MKYGVTWSTIEGGSCYQTGYEFSDIGEAAIAARNGPFDQDVQVDVFPGAELRGEWQMIGAVELDDDRSAPVLHVFSVRRGSSRSLCDYAACHNVIPWDATFCPEHDSDQI